MKGGKKKGKEETGGGPACYQKNGGGGGKSAPKKPIRKGGEEIERQTHEIYVKGGGKEGEREKVYIRL